MSVLRPELTIALLNERGGEYLPGYLGIEIINLAPNTLTSRMAVKKLHIAPNQFLHAASVVALADTSCGYWIKQQSAGSPERAASKASNKGDRK